LHKIGIGFDLHTLKTGRKLMLGCVHFDDAELGLEGHSDADVVAHAVCDALLGAGGMGDIGDHFPDVDPAYEDFPGGRFLELVATMLKDGSYEIVHIDCVVLSEAVKLGERKKAMAAAMAKHLGVTPDVINVKATTCEGHGAVGRREVIACQAVATVKNT
jgi:2-C-methyl-D-erythritol 2,4-cyclodiphosphate synthase